MKEPTEFDLDPKYVRRRNHPGREPIFQPGGLTTLAVYFGGLALGLAVATVVYIIMKPTLFPVIDRMVNGWFN